MGLVDKQWIFLKDVVKLISKAEELGFVVTASEMYRPIEMQRIYVKNGRSKTMYSRHGRRLAIDLNFFTKNEGGKLRLTWDRDTIKPLGDYWESLRPENRWGGSWRGRIEKGKSKFVDIPHFEHYG